MSTQRSMAVVFLASGWMIQIASPGPGTQGAQKDEATSIDQPVHQTAVQLRCTILSDTEDKWLAAKNFRWIFSPDGTCTPLRIRLASDSGSWVELEFNPLTAFATENASRFD